MTTTCNSSSRTCFWETDTNPCDLPQELVRDASTCCWTVVGPVRSSETKCAQAHLFLLDGVGPKALSIPQTDSVGGGLRGEVDLGGCALSFVSWRLGSMKCGTWYVWRQKPAWNSRELRRYLLILRKCCQGSRCCLPSSESRDIGSCWTPNSTHPPNFYTLQKDASDRSSERGQPGHGSLLHAPQHLDTCEMLRNPMLPHSSTDAANMRHAFGVLKWGTLNPWALLKKPSFGWLWYRRKQETSTSLDGWSFNFRRKIWNSPYQVKLSESQMCRGQLQGSLLLKSGCLQVFVWLFVCLSVCLFLYKHQLLGTPYAGYNRQFPTRTYQYGPICSICGPPFQAAGKVWNRVCSNPLLEPL